jgi:hypothetical protein
MLQIALICLQGEQRKGCWEHRIEISGSLKGGDLDLLNHY